MQSPWSATFATRRCVCWVVAYWLGSPKRNDFPCECSCRVIANYEFYQHRCDGAWIKLHDLRLPTDLTDRPVKLNLSSFFQVVYLIASEEASMVRSLLSYHDWWKCTLDNFGCDAR